MKKELTLKKNNQYSLVKRYWWVFVLALVLLVFLYNSSGSSVSDLGEVLVVVP
jgi:hypothetical protein